MNDDVEGMYGSPDDRRASQEWFDGRVRSSWLLVMWLLIGISSNAHSQGAPNDHPGVVANTNSEFTVSLVKVHGKALEGNLAGDPPDRNVAVFLPRGYSSTSAKRFPVIYLLHGFKDRIELWYGSEPHWIKLPELLARSQIKGVGGMIVVMPDAYTRYQGSMFSSSATTGDWDSFVASDLVGYIDSHFRTLPQASSRAIVGHSMGGYGALRIGMRHPDIFSVVYAMNPCCLTPEFAVPNDATSAAKMEAIRSFAEELDADIATQAAFASAAAWSANPLKPPFYLDLPWSDGKRDNNTINKWIANRPLVMVDQYIPNLRKLKAIGFDAGDRDHPEIQAGMHKLDEELAANHIAHSCGIYPGDHTSGAAQRMEEVVLPFLMRNLAF